MNISAKNGLYAQPRVLPSLVGVRGPETVDLADRSFEGKLGADCCCCTQQSRFDPHIPIEKITRAPRNFVRADDPNSQSPQNLHDDESVHLSAYACCGTVTKSSLHSTNRPEMSVDIQIFT